MTEEFTMKFDALPIILFPPQLSDQQLQDLLQLLQSLIRLIEHHYADQLLRADTQQTSLDLFDEHDVPF